jgi:hypothetical protein
MFWRVASGQYLSGVAWRIWGVGVNVLGFPKLIQTRLRVTRQEKVVTMIVNVAHVGALVESGRMLAESGTFWRVGVVKMLPMCFRPLPIYACSLRDHLPF